MMKRIVLIDAYGLAVRCYFGSLKYRPAFETPTPTNALFGYCHTILSTIQLLKPTHIAACLDLGKPTFRHEVYPKYKHARKRTPFPDDLKVQLGLLERVNLAIGANPVYAEGFEADDIIGSISKKAVQENVEVVILSTDKDMIQLLEPGVTLYRRTKQSYFKVNISAFDIMTPENAHDKIGVVPRKYATFLALCGDQADGIPGAPGIGPVWAKRLLNHYDTLDDVLRGAALNEPIFGSSKRAHSIAENEDQIRLSWKLAKIVGDISDVPDLELFSFDGFPFGEECMDILTELNLDSLTPRMEKVALLCSPQQIHSPT